MKKAIPQRESLRQAHRLVIKIGSHALIQRNGRPDLPRMRALVREMAALHQAGREVILVSSGAIGAGLHALGLRARPDNLPDLQMAAAVGQTRLISRYSALFARERCRIGQVLLTHDDLRDRVRHLNARNTLMNLLRRRIVPVVNENDVVSVDEIKFGDNDLLASRVAMLTDADLLILLSTVDGFRRTVAGGRRTRRVAHLETVPDDLLATVAGAGGAFSTGGMRSKLAAARDFTELGRLAVIANGRKPRVLERILAGEDEGTLIGDASVRSTGGSRKRWIGFFHKTRGAVIIDEGARRAVEQLGKSLLPAGILDVEGDFPMGAVIQVRSAAGSVVAHGLTEYSSEDIRRIRGRKTTEIEALLGTKDYDEVIHRDHMLVATRSRSEPPAV